MCTVSRMSGPAAPNSAARCWTITNVHAVPDQRKTTQSIRPMLPGPKRVAAIVWLPEPVKAPQRTLKMGSVTFGSPRCELATACCAAACEQSPSAVGAAEDVAAEVHASVKATAVTACRTGPNRRSKRTIVLPAEFDPTGLFTRHRAQSTTFGPRPTPVLVSEARTCFKAERAGFEPATHLSARTRFPVALLRPLGHLSNGGGGI